jgi:hypothetical protein
MPFNFRIRRHGIAPEPGEETARERGQILSPTTFARPSVLRAEFVEILFG